MLWSGALLFIYISLCNAAEDGFLSLKYSWDIIFRPKYTSTNIKWAVTAAARPRHNAINSPSWNNKGLTVAALLICGSPPLTTVLLPPSHHLFNFDTQWSASISTCESQWRFVEKGSCCEPTWPPAWRLGAAGEQTLKWPLSGSHTFKGYFWPGCEAGDRTVERCRRESLQHWAAHLQFSMEILNT